MKLGIIMLDTLRVILKTGGILGSDRGDRGGHFPRWPPVGKIGQYIKAADDDAGKLLPVFLKRLYLLHICIFSFFLFNASLTTI